MGAFDKMHKIIEILLKNVFSNYFSSSGMQQQNAIYSVNPV